MGEVIVGRPVDGITLNDELEFLLDDAGKIRVFNSPGQARSFLLASGVGIESLRHMTIMESCGTCRRCSGSPFKSLLDGCEYLCLTCNKFEQDA